MCLTSTEKIHVRVVFKGISICSFLKACGVNMPAALLLPQLSVGTEVVDKWDPLQYEQSSQECALDSGKLSATQEQGSCSVEAETNSFMVEEWVSLYYIQK